MLERTHLAIIREVDRLGTLTAAARALNLTQSALSHAIRRLEQQTGAALLYKHGRRLRFTEAGHYLCGVAERLLAQFDDAETILAQFAAGRKGSLRIGVECHPCYRWLVRVVSPFLARWPEVDIDIRREFRFSGIGALIHHEIDMLITPDPLHTAGLCFTPLFDYEMVLVVSRSHPLVAQGVARPEDMADEILLSYPVKDERLDILNLFFAPAKCRPRDHKHVEDTEILLRMVAAGRGVSAIPDWLAAEYLNELPLATLRLGRHGLQKQLYIGRREKDRRAPFIDCFLEIAEDIKPAQPSARRARTLLRKL